jgi:hypothetical protein
MDNNNFNLGEKDIYKLFNNIEIDENEFDDIREEVSEIQKKRIKKNLNRRINTKKYINILKYGSIAAAISLVVLIGAGTASPTFAENIPVLNSITQALNDKFGYHGDYTKFSQLVNKSVTSNGVTLTVNEALADDSKIIIGYTVKSNKKIEGLETASLSRFLKVNNKNIDGSTGSIVGNYINDYTYVASEEIHTNLPKNVSIFNVNLDINELSKVKGKWDFAFSIFKDNLVKNSKIFKPDIKIDFSDSIATINKIVFSPIDTSIFVSGNSKSEDKSKNPSDDIFCSYWIVFDDNGVEVLPKGTGTTSRSNTKTFSAEMNYEKLKYIPKYLTIIPCNIYSTGEEGEHIDKNGKRTSFTTKGRQPEEISKVIDGIYPIDLPQGKMGKLTINEVKTENNATTIKFTAVGKAPYFQASELHVRDSSGNDITPKRYLNRVNYDHPNEFTIVYPELNSNEKYTLNTTDLSNYEFREDLKFTVPLNK